jgi:hypothetical protein
MRDKEKEVTPLAGAGKEICDRLPTTVRTTKKRKTPRIAHRRAYFVEKAQQEEQGKEGRFDILFDVTTNQ